MDLLDAGAVTLARELKSGSVVSHLERVLDRIAERDPELNAFYALSPDSTAQAQALDELPQVVRARLPLFGVPVAVKEEIDVAGMVTTLGGCGNSTPAEADAEVVARLRAAGAVIVGKTNQPEFGQAPFTTGAWGVTRNPHNPIRSPGGSSGGSAVAVASKMVPLALGSDGGGSIRIPAAWNGLIGIKPTRGRVSTAPNPDLWQALETYGPLAREVDDVDLALRLLAPVGIHREAPARLSVGWTLGSCLPGVSPRREIGQAVAHAAGRLAEHGHRVEHGSIRWAETPLTYLIQYHRGILDEARSLEHPELMEARTQRIAALAARIPERLTAWAAGSIGRIEAAMDQVFETLDVLLTPVTPMLPPPIRPVHEWGYVRAHWTSSRVIAYTSYWNLAGLPAASVPAGRSKTGLPLAVQVIGRRGADETVLAVAKELLTAP